MKSIFIITSVFLISINNSFSQDTFSIVAVDPFTGEVGSAGASCVDLFQFGLPSDDFIGQLIPGVGKPNPKRGASITPLPVINFYLYQPDD